MNITEDYVSVDTYNAMKEKGFSDPVNEEAELVYGVDIARPTIQKALKWLRVVHNCSIEITSNGYLMDNDATWECDIKFRHRLYFRHIQCEKTYEDCAEAAIKYCLENLI